MDEEEINELEYEEWIDWFAEQAILQAENADYQKEGIMEKYLRGCYKSELLRILLRLATDLDIYQRILDIQIGDVEEVKRELKRLKKQNP